MKRARGTGWKNVYDTLGNEILELAHAHMRQFQDNFINFMRENYTTDVTLGPLRAAQ